MVTTPSWVYKVLSIVLIAVGSSGLTWALTSNYYKNKIEVIATKNDKAVAVLASQLKSKQSELNQSATDNEQAMKTKESQTDEKTNSRVDSVGNGSLQLRDKNANCKPKSVSPAVVDRNNETAQGAVLSRQASEFLLELTAEADKTNAALGLCIKQYNEVKDQNDKLKQIEAELK